MKAKKLADSNDGCDETCDRNDEIKLNFSEDYRYLSRSPIGILIQNEYCKCGNVGARVRRYDDAYGIKSTTKHNASNEVYELDKGAFYLTKKSLMLNQFLEYKSEALSCAVHANDVCINRFNKSCDKVERGAQNKTTTQTVCLPSSVFCDKRLVSLFRSVALYWFFCLNTVLAKGDLFKRKTLSGLEVPKSDPLAAFDSNLRLQICPDVFENFDDDSSNDFLWNLMLKAAGADAVTRSGLLVYAEHSKEKLFADLFKKVLLDLADTNGVFVTKTPASEGSPRRKMQTVADGVERAPASPKKMATPKRGSKKYAFDMFDCGHIGGTFYNRIVWRNRAIKNKLKSKRKERFVRSERIQEIIVECADDDQLTDDGFEEVVTAMEERKAAESATSGDSGCEDVFVDFDSYVQDLKRQDEENNANAETNPTSPVCVSASSIEPEVQPADEVTDSYFLPDGMLNVEERDYPEYDLWCSPLIAEQVLPPKASQSQNVPHVKIAEPSPETFKPYSLWESSFAAEDDYIPNFETPEDFSVFSMPYYPPKKDDAARPQPSEYTLWGSPNLIDILRNTGGVCLPNDNEYLASRSASSSDSLDSLCSRTGKLEMFTRRYENGHLMRGKFLNLKPVVNGFVSFSDRGAFKYYEKSHHQRAQHRNADAYVPKTTLLEVMDAADIEVKNIMVTPPQNEFNTRIYFKPIQPAFKVDTDLPAIFERSQTGTLYYRNRKLMTFKHESDSQRNTAGVFQPKFTVSTNDVACQTDRFGCPSVVNCNAAVCETQGFHCYGSSGEKKNQQPHVSGATFFYSLEEVFNFLGKPGLGNIDVKAHVDFSCMF